MNIQSIEKRRTGSRSLEVHSIFKTIQGEGPYAGFPSIFIRLAGCNLQCSFCDTDYTGNRSVLLATDILEEVIKLAPPPYLVVITGGEPFRQDISFLCRLLHAYQYKIQIETNGTLFIPDMPWLDVTIVCSPKTAKINGFFQNEVDFWKYVVQEGQINPTNGLPLTALGEGPIFHPTPARPENIYISPLDEGHIAHNKLNTIAAVEVCLKFGYRLSLQLHKIVGLP